MAKLVTVYPVEGRWLPGVPAEPTEVTPTEAARLIKSGAFAADEQPEPPAEEIEEN